MGVSVTNAQVQNILERDSNEATGWRDWGQSQF